MITVEGVIAGQPTQRDRRLGEGRGGDDRDGGHVPYRVMSPKFLAAASDGQFLRRITPGAVGLLDPVADGRLVALHASENRLAVTSTTLGVPSGAGSEIRKPVPTVRRPAPMGCSSSTVAPMRSTDMSKAIGATPSYTTPTRNLD